MAHRKQILIRQYKKQTSEKSLSFKAIVEDKSEGKEMSHSLLRGLILSSVNVLDLMKKKEIEKIGKAYGVNGKQNTKKAALIDIVKRSVIQAAHMPHSEVFEEVLPSSVSVHKKTFSEHKPSTASALVEEPQPSTSSAESPSAEGMTMRTLPTELPETLSLFPHSSSKESLSSSDDEVCGHCQKVGKEGILWIQCSTCLVWYHRNCAGLRYKKEWDKYQAENVNFSCKQCR